MLKIDYKSSDNEEDFIEKGITFNYCLKNGVPKNDALRSMYIKEVNTKIKHHIISKSKDISDIETVTDHVLDYYVTEREKLSQDHKIIIFTVLSRLMLLMSYSYNEGNEYDDNLDIEHLMERGLVNSENVRVCGCTLQLFFSLLNGMINKINNLRYTETIERYIYILLSRFAEFTFYKKDDNRILNNRKFVTNSNGQYRVNSRYYVESERQFYGLILFVKTRLVVQEYSHVILPRVFIRQKYKTFTIREELNLDFEYFRFLIKIMLSHLMKPVLQSIEREIQKMACEVGLLIGEKDRYVENEVFNAPEPYGIIAKLRPFFIDKLYRIMQNQPIETFCERHFDYLKEITTKKKDVKMRDINIDRIYDGIVYKIVNKIVKLQHNNYDISNYTVSVSLETIKSNDVNKYMYDICNDLSRLYVYNCRTIPIMMQCDYEWYFFGKPPYIIKHYSFLSCFLAWMKYIIEDEEMQGELPDKLNLNKIETMFSNNLPLDFIQSREKPETKNSNDDDDIVLNES